MPDLVNRLDDLQRRRRFVGLPLGVIYKFFDDQGNYLAAILTYYAFIAIFPVLLIASSVLGFLLQGNPELEQRLLSSALAQFPIVGTQLGEPGGIQGSTTAVIVGSLAALYGVMGLGQASQNALNTAWAIPRNSRLNPVMSRARALGLLALGGMGVLAVTLLGSLGSHVEMFGTQVDTGLSWTLKLVSWALTALLLSVLMNLATTERHRLRTVLPGGIAVAVMWQLLQLLGGLYVGRVVSRADQMNGVFALVLGLVALIYLAAVMAVLGIELNVVVHKRLYPRALLTPFTDAVELTEADRRVYTDYARAQRHKGFERVSVTFDREEADAGEASRGAGAGGGVS